MCQTTLEKNNSDFLSGKISPKDYGKHIILCKSKNTKIEKTTHSINSLLKKLR